MSFCNSSSSDNARELSHLPVPVPAGISPCWLGGQDCTSLCLLTLLLGRSPFLGPCSARMGCALPKPSRQGFAFPPSARPREPSAPPEPAGGVRSQASRPGWSNAAGRSLPVLRLSQPGRVPGLGSPTHPFPAPLSLVSRHKPCQSIPSPAQHTPALHRALLQPQQTPRKTRQP